MTNGNITIRNILKILHWNAGNALLQNKLTELEALILEKTPDILFVSEANLMATLPVDERQIVGYSLHLPGTVEKHKYVRIVLLIKEGIDFKIQPEMMHEDVAIIWLSIMKGNRSIMKVGSVYREHRLLLKQHPNITKSDEAQLFRWNKFLTGWKLAARAKHCVLIGDTNLDQLKWNNPDNAHEKMVLWTKEVIEEAGHIQVIENFTRSWPGQSDSLVDHC